MSLGQMDALRILQGMQMNRDVHVFGYHTKFPAASLYLFDTASIIIFGPIYDRLLIPFMRKRLKYTPTLLQRVGVGYLCVVLSVLTTFVVERMRKHLFAEGEFDIVEQDGEDVEVVRISIFWLALPQVFNGIAEVMAAVGLLEFFYSQVLSSGDQHVVSKWCS